MTGLPPLPAHLDPRGKHRDRTQSPGLGWRHFRVFTKVVSALLSAFLLAAFGVYWYEYRTVSGGFQRLSIFGGSVPKPAKDIDGKDQNILIVGNDDRETASTAELAKLHTGRDGGSLNTDTMMIVHVPADGSKATLISLPRDSYVDIPGHGKYKLNSAYPDGYTAASGSPNAKRAAGAQLLVHTIENLTGLTIDHFVSVDLLGFYDISNSIGGVTVNMCQAVKEPDSGINLPAGRSSISGVQALAFVRQRYNFPNGLGDLDRVQRQRYFLTAAFRKLTSGGVLLNPIKLNNLLNAVRRNLYMDSGLDPLALAKQMTNLNADNIVGQTIPTDGFGHAGDGSSVVVVNPAEVQTFVTRLIGPTDSKLAKAPLVAASTVTVNVLNASGTNGIATTNAGVLKQAGFHTGTIDSTTGQTVTVIEYADGMQSQAKTVAKYVPGAVLQKTSSVSAVTLILGSDGKKAVIPVSHSSSASSSKSSTPTSHPTTSSSSKTPGKKAIDAGCIY